MDRWDRVYDRKFDKEHQTMVDYLTPHINPDSLLLEIGCGVGELACAIGSEVKEYLAFDSSEPKIKKALQLKHPDNVRFFICDGKTLPPSDEFLDIICSQLVFQHLEPEVFKGYIKESYRVLKYGGKFIFQVVKPLKAYSPTPYNYAHTEEELRVLLKNFSEVKIDRQTVIAKRNKPSERKITWLWVVATK